MGSSEHGRRALEALGKLLREKPHADNQAFAEATEHLAAFRDETIEHQRGGATAVDRERLEKVNAVISVVLAGHFPLGSIPWHEIEGARGWLAEMVGET